MTSDARPSEAAAVAVAAQAVLPFEDFRRLAGAGAGAGTPLDEATVEALYPMVLSLRSLAAAVDRAMAAGDGVAASEDAVPPL